MQLQNIAWAEKFRPERIEDCFLPKQTEDLLKKIIAEKNIPNLMFSGSAGIGKTTTAVALVTQIGAEYIKINGSLSGNIDTLRNEIQQFASTVSFNGERKYILLDEADYLTAATQAALRGFMDDYSKNAGFILTANYRNKIIEPIISRLVEVNFLFPKGEKGELAKKLYNFLCERLDEENVEYDKKAVQKFIVDHLTKTTDIRQIITQAQVIAKTGIFNFDSLLNSDSSRFSDLIESIKAKNFNEMRKWVGENSDIEPSAIFRQIYEKSSELATKPFQIANIVVIINEHQFKHAFVADKEINLVSCVSEVSAVL